MPTLSPGRSADLALEGGRGVKYNDPRRPLQGRTKFSQAKWKQWRKVAERKGSGVRVAFIDGGGHRLADVVICINRGNERKILQFCFDLSVTITSAGQNETKTK